MTVKDALAAAGGLTQIADRKGVVLVRERGERITIDLDKLAAGQAENPVLKPGDTLVVKPSSIQVSGRVKSPGSYELQANMTVMQALAAAGGPIEGADLEAAYVERQGKSIPVNLKKLLEGVDLSENITLLPDDVLYVPDRVVTITGEVQNPGQYTLVPGKNDRLQDLIKMAGGPTKQANLKKVHITRVEGGKRPRLVVDATQIDPTNNPTLRRGDSVHVPALSTGQRRRLSLSQVYEVVLIIYYLSVILRR